MKNNKITFSQFLSVCFLSCLSSVMFISRTPSVFVLLTSVLALFVNYAVFMLYKGQLKKVLIPVSIVYLSLYCVLTVVKFADYMNTALSYGPDCLIIIALLCFTFFCTVKGGEALSRASTVIFVFVIAGLIYMLVCTFTNINFKLTVDFPDEIISSVILFFPSLLYIINYDNIINVKPKLYAVYSGILVAALAYFILIASGINSAYPIQHLPAISKIGVFKGSDCILLSILTISSVFSVSSSTVSIFKNSKHNYLTHSIYIAVLLGISIIVSLIKLLGFIENYVFMPFSVVVMLIIILLCAVKRKNYV